MVFNMDFFQAKIYFDILLNFTKAEEVEQQVS